MKNLHALDLKEEYGDVVLSIIAGQYAYSDPREDAESYTAVEIALMTKKVLVLPSAVGIDGFDELFEDGGVAGFVSWDDVDRLRAALRARVGMEEVTP